MFRYLYTILNPSGFTSEQIENGTLHGLEPMLNLGQDWWDNQREQVAKAIALGNLLDYERNFFEDRIVVSQIWDDTISKEEYDSNANISIILDRLEEIGYNISVYMTEI